jgi:putative DNA primase/helicase
VKNVLVGGKTRPFNPSTDMEALAAAAKQIGDLGLNVVDPVILAVAGDSHKNAEVRRGLQPLVEFTAERRCTTIGITHLTKGTAGRDPIERVTGSLAFAAGPRLVMMTRRPLDKTQKNRLVRAKSNIGPDGDGFKYSLIQEPLVGWKGLSAQRVIWGHALSGTARDLLNDVEMPPEAAPSRFTMATKFLREMLANGPVPRVDLETQAKATGISWATAHRAAEHLRIFAARVGGIGDAGKWVWRLPDHASTGEEVEL